MAITPANSTDIETISLGLLQRYLVANGWQRMDQPARFDREVPTHTVPRIRQEMLEGRSGGRRSYTEFVLSEPGLSEIELIIPRETTSPDYVRLMKGAIRTLSDLEGRAPEDVTADIGQIGFDVVRSSIPSSMVFSETIPLRMAAEYASGIRTLLATVAYTEMWPLLYFPRLGREALAYADRCRFGHTFKGSFGFNIGSPIDPPGTDDVVRNEIPTPLGRRVLERFARGVAEVCSVINGGDESALLKNAERGFGSNGYRRFAELLEGTAGSGLVIEFSFSSEWKLPSDILKTQTFSIDTRHLELSRRVAKQLQSHYESDLTVSLSESLPSAGDRTTTVVGDVIRLARGDKSGNVADRGSENEIAVQWYHRELGTTRIWIPLGRDDYLQALEAHKQRRSVRVTGTITRNGQFWLLLNPSNFAVI